jgi:tRNA G18 (ribose-2'-O)-methylase SpoU
MIKEISSVNNQYVKDLLSLKDKNTRNELKLFLVEGYHLVEEALKHHLLDSVLSTDKEVLNNIDIANKYLVSDAVIKKLSTTKTPQNIIGVVKNNINTSFDTLLSKRDLKLIIAFFLSIQKLRSLRFQRSLYNCFLVSFHAIM